MQQNVGGIDKVIRIIAGLGLLSLLVLLDGSERWFGLIGVVPLFTAAVSWCPAYTLLGINTCPMKRA